jgi:predicted nucleic acid-binding protein
MARRCVLDTNVLLSFLHQSHPDHSICSLAVRHLTNKTVQVCFTPQTVREFWNVSTRPRDRNGFGVSLEYAEGYITSIEAGMTLLPDSEQVYRTWRRLCFLHQVRGVQVHDALLAASLEAHEVEHLLTFNTADFKRFPYVSAVAPKDVAALVL